MYPFPKPALIYSPTLLGLHNSPFHFVKSSSCGTCGRDCAPLSASWPVTLKRYLLNCTPQTPNFVGGPSRAHNRFRLSWTWCYRKWWFVSSVSICNNDESDTVLSSFWKGQWVCPTNYRGIGRRPGLCYYGLENKGYYSGKRRGNLSL